MFHNAFFNWRVTLFGHVTVVACSECIQRTGG